MPATESQRLVYRDKFRSLHNEPFQTWFEELARALHPAGDFQPIRKTRGDGGLDGFVINSQLVYQVYAPARIDELRDSDTAAKIKADFQSAFSTLGGKLKAWVFVHNHPEAKIGQLSATAISDLKTQNPSIKINVLDVESLWDRVKHLAGADLSRLFGNPQQSDLEVAWNKVNERTRHNLELVGHQLGGVLHVSRPNELAQLDKRLEQHDVVVVSGSSGAGKSALVKTWLKQQPAAQLQIVWLRAEDLQRFADKPLAELLDPGCLTTEFFRSSPSPRLIVVVDGLEQCYARGAFQHLKELASVLAKVRAAGSWRLVLTCQGEEWARVQNDVLRHTDVAFSKLGIVAVENFSRIQFRQVVAAFPVLGPLVWRKEIARLLLRPKILDILVTRLQTRDASQVARWVGESDLIEWWWCEVIEKGQPVSARGRIVRQLAEKLSDRLENEVCADEFSGEEAVCSELVHDNICRIVEGRIGFAHDLFGDWARQRQLLSQSPAFKAYLQPRLDCPPWQRAVRLLGLHLLERRTELSDWRACITEFAGESHISTLARDLLLEAAVFAADPAPLLEKLWPELAAKEGELLRRFLKRFLHAATVPDFRSVEYFQKENPDLVTEIAARHRLPYFPYWHPVLGCLYSHLEEVTSLARDEVAETGRVWLLVADGELLDRSRAAQLVVRNAEKILPWEFSRYSRLSDEEARPIYEAALAAAPDLPDRVAKLALKLSGRLTLEATDIPPDADPESLGQCPKYSGDMAIILSDYMEDDPPQSWQDGPKRHVSRGFQQAFLQGGAAVPLIVQQPVVATEVILALLISWPRTRIRRGPYGPDIGADRHGFQFLHPDESFYTSGPFLLFLRHQPQHALALILRLVNFATERCVEVFFGGEEANVSIRTPFDGGERVWIGDWRVFYWFRYPMITAHIVGAALMALEKWFYESLDAGRSVENEIQTILTGTRSVAFAGVLFCVGKRNPELLTGPLRELICAREFHLWESVKQAEYSGINVGSFLDPGIMRKLKLEWEQMPHRRANLHELCCRLFLTKSESRPVFERIRTLWTSRSSEATTGPTRRFRGFGGLQNLNWRIGRK